MRIVSVSIIVMDVLDRNGRQPGMRGSLIHYFPQSCLWDGLIDSKQHLVFLLWESIIVSNCFEK